jgi:hypothetical protein
MKFTDIISLAVVDAGRVRRCNGGIEETAAKSKIRYRSGVDQHRFHTCSDNGTTRPAVIPVIYNVQKRIILRNVTSILLANIAIDPYCYHNGRSVVLYN